MKNESLVKIASVKLVNGGLGGAQVSYVKEVRRNSRDFKKTRNEVNTECVHGELINLFESLCGYLLDICCYPIGGVDRKILLNELEFTGVTYGDSGFVLSGKLRVLGSASKKVLVLNTPLVTVSDDYESYAEVCKILDSIYVETTDYMSGAKTFKDEELLLKFNKNDGEFQDVFKNLDEAGKKQMATKILEEMGSIIIHQSEIEGGEEPEGAIVEVKKEKKVKELKEPNVVTMIQTGSPKVEDMNFDDDEFMLPTVE